MHVIVLFQRSWLISRLLDNLAVWEGLQAASHEGPPNKFVLDSEHLYMETLEALIQVTYASFLAGYRLLSMTFNSASNRMYVWYMNMCVCVYNYTLYTHLYVYTHIYVYIYIHIYIYICSRFSVRQPSLPTEAPSTPHPPCFNSANSHRDRASWGLHPRNCRPC